MPNPLDVLRHYVTGAIERGEATAIEGRPACIFCQQNGELNPAALLAPQADKGGPWDWMPVCDAHADGWWDGSDYPDGVGAPALLRLVPQA